MIQRTFKIAALLLLELVTSRGLAQSPSAVELWRATTPNVYAAMIAVDANRNLFVTGGFPMVTKKYDPNGTELWQRDYTNPNYRTTRGTWLTVDPAGNVIVIGNLFFSNPTNPAQTMARTGRRYIPIMRGLEGSTMLPLMQRLHDTSGFL